MSFAEEEATLTTGYMAAVDRRLAWYFGGQRHRARRLSMRVPALAGFESLWVEAERSTQGGKKLRPALVLAAFDALQISGRFGSSMRQPQVTEQSVVDVATAFELLHTAFLLHDDVIDGDVVRRGRLNLIGRCAAHAAESGADAVTSRRWGEACAVLAGDLLIHGAHAMVDRAGLPEDVRLAIQQVLDDALFVTAAGEQGDVGLAAGILDAGLENVLGVTCAKTAHYSFADPLRAAAILAGADAELTDLLDRIGALIGSAFQLRDDVLGIFGDEDVTGKSVDRDLINGKITALAALAVPDPSRPGPHDLGLRGLPPADARAVMERTGAREGVERIIRQHRREVVVLTRDPRIPPALRLLLTQFLDLATERES